MSKLISLYTSILDYAGLGVDANGFIYTQHDADKTPLTIGGKELILPTTEVLRRPHNGEQTIFHPLAENALQKESAIIRTLRSALNVRMNYFFGILAKQLLQIANDKTIHGRFTPDQRDLLIALKEADETSEVNFTKLMLAYLNKDYERIFVHCYLNKGGKVRGKKYARTGVISFPMYELLKEKGVDIPDVKLRAKDVEIFLNLYRLIFPHIDEPESYNYGSDSDIAPYLDALMMSTIKVLASINDIIDEYNDYITEKEALTSNSEWVEGFNDLRTYLGEIRNIPHQTGVDDVQPARPVNTGAQMPLPPRPQDTFQPAQPVSQQPQFQQPAPQQQAPQPVAPGLHYTDKGLDFQSLLQNRPDLANRPNPLAMNPMGMMQPNPGMRPPPSWAQPQMNQFGQPVQPMYGQPAMMGQQPQFNQFGQPMQPGMQPQMNQFGQPAMMGQQPQFNQFGQPMQPGMQPMHGNQPASAGWSMGQVSGNNFRTL
jgi:hypothetical protein